MMLPEVTEKNFESYIAFIRRQPMYKEEDLQAKLLAASLLDDAKAKKQVFNSYLRFVVSTAEKLVDVYMSKHMNQPSRKTLIVGCINEGNKGLLQAISQYHDKQRDSKFMSFSLQVSGHYMKRYIANFYNNL